MKALLNVFMISLATITLMALPISEAHAQSRAEVARAQALANESGQNESGPAPKTQEEAAGGVYYDSEGVATRVRSTTTTRVVEGDMLHLILLLGIGVFVGRMWRYAKWTRDMRVAVGAAIIMVGATIKALMTARRNINADTYQVEIKEDGSVNNMQVDAIREQIESYRELEKLASTKWKIEAAGAAAFTASAAYALFIHTRVTAQVETCGQALTQAALAALPPNVPLATACDAAQGAMAPVRMSIQSPPTGEQSASIGTRMFAELNAFKSAFSACPPAAAICGQMALEAAEAIAQTPDPEVIVGDIAVVGSTAPMGAPHTVASFEFQVFNHFLSYQEMASAWRDTDISFDSPYNDLFLPATEKLNIQPIANHLTRFEYERYLSGEVSSLALADISRMSTSSDRYFAEAIVRQARQHERQLVSLVADALLPSAHAWGVRELGLGGGIAAAFVASTRQTARMLDRFMATPKNRAVVFGSAAAISTAAAVMSKRAEGQYANNAEKLEDLLREMENLQTMPTAFTGQNTVSPGATNTQAPRSVRPPALTSDGAKTPCLAGQTDKGCNNLSDELGRKEFSEFGAPMANLASLTGATADGFIGTDTLSDGTLANVDKLANQQALANSALRAARDRADQLNKKLGIDDDFEKATNRFRDNMAQAVIKRAETDPSFGRVANAFSGNRAGIPLAAVPTDLSEAKEVVESVIADGAKEVPSDGSKSGDFDFNFEFDDGYGFDDSYANAVYGDDGMIIDIKGGDYEATGDIVSNRDVSLFQIITVRYFKSGFPRLFDLRD